MGQDLRDLIDTMFWLKASPEKRTSETVRNVLVGTTPAAPAEFPEVPGNGFVKIGLDGKWFTDPTVFLTKREGDSYYFRNNQFPMDPAVYLAGDRTFKNFVDSARASFTGGDGIDIVAGDIRVDNTVSRVGHQHSLTLSGDVSGSGQVAGTISTTVNAIRGGVVPPPASSGYFYWTGSSYSWIGTPPPATIALDDLADVALASVAAGQVLWYDGSVGQWINRTMIAADLPAHASRHHFDGADPLAGQSIAGLRISDKPSFAGLIAKVAGTLTDIDFHSLAGYRQMSIRWSDTSQQIEVFSSNDTGGARANRMLIPRSSSSPVSILLGLTVTGTTKLDTSLTGMLKATAGVVSVAGAADLPLHASRHQWDGADPLAGQSIAGLLVTSTPRFQSLEIVRALGATIETASKVTLYNNDLSWGQSFWSDSGGNLRLSFLQGDSTWTDRFKFMRTGAFQIGGTDAITSSRGGRFTDLVVTGQTTLATSLTGMLKATAGVVSVAGASDLPLHASRHQWDGADPIQGQQLVGLRAYETPTFGGIRGSSVIGYLPFLENNGTEIMRLMSTGMLVHQNISLDGDLRIGNLTGILYAQNGTVRVALGSELPSHTHFTSQVTEDTNLWFTYQRARDAITGAHPITVVNGLVSHVNTDGYRHVPANGYSNSGKFLVAGGSPGSYSWNDITAGSLPVHAFRHHFDGSDPLAGQSIAGLLTSSIPTFAGLNIITPSAGTLADLSFRSTADLRRMVFRWDNTNDLLELFSNNDDGSARAARMQVPRSSSLPVSILLGLTVTGTTKLDTSLTGMLKATAGVVSVAGAADLPLHASRHQWDGADPLAGQSIAGLLVTSTPRFQSLEIVRALGATIETASKITLYNNDLTYGVSHWLASNGDLRIAFLQNNSIWTDRFAFTMAGAFKVGGSEAITASRGGRLTDLVVTGQTTLSTSLTGMLKATAGVVSVAGANDLPGGPYLPLAGGKRVSGWVAFDSTVYSTEIISFSGYDLGQFGITLNTAFSIQGDLQFEVSSPTNLNNVVSFESKGDFKFRAIRSSVSTTLPVLGNEQVVMLVGDSGPFEWETNLTQEVAYFNGTETTIISAGGNPIGIASLGKCMILVGPISNSSERCSLFIV